MTRRPAFVWIFRYADGSHYGTRSPAEAARLIEGQSRLEAPAVRIAKYSEKRGVRTLVDVIVGAK